MYKSRVALVCWTKLARVLRSYWIMTQTADRAASCCPPVEHHTPYWRRAVTARLLHWKGEEMMWLFPLYHKTPWNILHSFNCSLFKHLYFTYLCTSTPLQLKICPTAFKLQRSSSSCPAEPRVSGSVDRGQTWRCTSHTTSIAVRNYIHLL